MTENQAKNINPKEIVATWRWRIHRLGYNVSTFAPEVKLHRVQFSAWCRGVYLPSLENFYTVENHISNLEAQKGIKS